MHYLKVHTLVKGLMVFLFFSPHSILASTLLPEEDQKHIVKKSSIAENRSPVTIDLEESFFDPKQGTIIYGPFRHAVSGSSISGVGDVNGDGVDDVAIGAGNTVIPLVSASYQGFTYIVYGKKGGYDAPILLREFHANTTTSIGFIVAGAFEGDVSGNSVSNAGDINDDGIPDILIGAWNAGIPAISMRPGASYIVYGKEGGYEEPLFLYDFLDSSNEKGFMFYGTPSTSRTIDWCPMNMTPPCDLPNQFGGSNRNVGDFNGDGVDDIVVGAPIRPVSGQDFAGTVYVLFGKKGGFEGAVGMDNWNENNPPIGVRINGPEELAQLGWAVSSAGDFNDDGFDDVLMLAPGPRPFQNDHVVAYVIYGRAEGSSRINLANLTPEIGFRIEGIRMFFSPYYYNNLGCIKDFNHDGIDDIIIGCPDESPQGKNQAGSAYILYGKQGGYSDFNLSNLTATEGFRIDGINAEDLLGTSVSGAGDVNRDGVADLIIGASGSSPLGRDKAGAGFVIYGKPGGYSQPIDLENLDPRIGFKIIGSQSNAGSAVRHAGDFNGDGFDDVIISAPVYSSLLAFGNGGASYVVYGFNQPPVLMQNTLNITGEETITLSPDNLYAFDNDTPDEHITFNVLNLHNGLFTRNDIDVTNFTQQDVKGGHIQFISTDCEEPPTYSIQVSDRAQVTEPADGTVSFTSTCDAHSGGASLGESLWYSPLKWLKNLRSFWTRPDQSKHDWHTIHSAPSAHSAELIKLKDSCEKFIEENQFDDPWYRYSLEDFNEHVEALLKRPEKIEASHVKSLKVRLRGIHKDFEPRLLEKDQSTMQNFLPKDGSLLGQSFAEFWTVPITPSLGYGPAPLCLGK